VDGQPRHVIVAQLELPCMHSGANLQSNVIDCRDDGEGAANRPRGTVERREEPVAGSINFSPAEPVELAPYGIVMIV
jgi:hypothetical protein